MVGYSLHVSPKKKRETEFHFVFQSEKDKVQRLKCYDMKKRASLSEHQVSGNAIKLKNVGIYSVNQNSGLCGIAINNQSTIKEPTAAEVFFDKIESGFADMGTILDDNEVDDLVDIKGVVDMTSCNIEMKNVYGAKKE